MLNYEVSHKEVFEKIPEKIPLTYYFPKRYTYPFYFTIHSNFFALVYFLLIFSGKIFPPKSKKFFIFETIVLFNLIITVLVYWIMLWPYARYDNPYLLTETILLHAIVPFIFFTAWTYRIFILKEKRFVIEYKEFYKFLIYPLLYLIIVVILYYATRQDYVYKVDYPFANKILVSQFLEKLKDYENIQVFVKENVVSINYCGKWGNAAYFFLNFDNLFWWVPVLVIFGVFLTFLFLIFTFIKINKIFVKINKE